MPSEAARKQMVVDYAANMNAGDVEAILAMFSDDIVFEDPVGAPPMVGPEALRRHITWSVECNAHEVPGRPVTSMDERFVVVPTTVTVRIPTKLTFNIISIVELDEDGRGTHVQAFWGLTDTMVGDGPKLDGIAHFVAVTEELSRLAATKTAEAGAAAAKIAQAKNAAENTTLGAETAQVKDAESKGAASRA